MATRVAKFADNATVNDLKEKLGQLGLSVRGNKAALKLRLLENVENFTEEQLLVHFPENLLLLQDEQQDHTVEDENASGEVGDGAANHEDSDMLDVELQYLREKVAKKGEIMELKKKLRELTLEENAGFTNLRSFVSFRDAEESLIQFSGDDSYPILRWIQQFEESAEVLGWDSRMKFIYAKRLMIGTAKHFLRTSSFTSWDELKAALVKEFNSKVTSAEIHNRLRNQRKKKEETLQQYVFSMQELASLGSIEECDVIQYIINGIPDTNVNKMLLYSANNLEELKHVLRKYDKMKLHTSTEGTYQQLKAKSAENKLFNNTRRKQKCYNCNEYGHISSGCQKPKRNEGSCFRCGSAGHRVNDCKENGKQVLSVNDINNQSGDSDERLNHGYVYPISNNFVFNIRFAFGEDNSDMSGFTCCLQTLLDSGSAISFVQEQFVPPSIVKSIDADKCNFQGINGSLLQTVGIAYPCISFRNKKVYIDLYIVKNNSMKYSAILGRDFLEKNNLELVHKNDRDNVSKNSAASCDQTQLNVDDAFKEILNINVFNDENKPLLDINVKLPFEVKQSIYNIVSEACAEECVNARVKEFEMTIRLTREDPFYCAPRRLPYSQRVELDKILRDLQDRGIIRESESPYASPIVLVSKKNRELRLCVDYRELNKHTVRDNYPLPVIEDLLDRLRDKKYFTTIDLRSRFHHIKMAANSIKYTSFVTPLGQFEYLKMPFGLKNAPSVFQRYLNTIFRNLITRDKLLIYMDDLLITSNSMEDHMETLKEVMQLVKENSLQLRYDKCKFLYEEVIYLGYHISANGIRPNPENLRAISEFPIPKGVKEVHSFLGLCSYFRKFIKNFAVLAKPLYDLLKKDTTFRFNAVEIETFEVLKSKLTQSPILAIYSPTNETELHCDASSIGFGAVLMQRQADRNFHPVFYYSKRTTDIESKYHSYELETLSIVYALRRFRIYLIGIPFKIITDCQSLTLTLNKRVLNPRISRWALELQNFEYKLEHRSASRMSHVDALSRCTEILVIEEGTLEFALAAAQNNDPVISKLIPELERGESKLFALINGLVYRKGSDRSGDVRFYVPKQLEQRVIQTHHDSLCHLGVNKCYEYLKKSYWFPNMKERIRGYIDTCLKCAYFSPKDGKVEASLHNIPKGSVPFETIHVDHYGPLATAKFKKKFIFVVVDGFSKFTKLYAVASTKTSEVISCLKTYFSTYSRPKRIISDRGTCFVSREFSDFLSSSNIIHHKVATLSPQSNGQVERINRLLTPMLAKESGDNSADWYENLVKVEFALNNTINRSTGFTPSKLVFGVDQKGEFCDGIMEHLGDRTGGVSRDLESFRGQASETIERTQRYSKEYFDKRHKMPRIYNEGDFVMVKNVVTTPGVNKKLLAKYRGPYKITKILGNDRYAISDLDNLQLTRLPYNGVCSAANMKSYVLCIDEIELITN